MIPPLPQAALDANPAFARVWQHVTTEVLEDDGSRRATNEVRTRRWKESVSAKRRGLEGSAEHEDGQDVDEHTHCSSGSQAKDVRFEDELKKARVARVSMGLLREILRDIAFVDHSGQVQDDGGEVLSTGSETGVARQKKSGSSSKLAGLKDAMLIISAYIDACSSGSGSSQDLADGSLLLEDDIALFKENIDIIADAVGTRLVELEQEISDIAAHADSNETDTQHGNTDTIITDAVDRSAHGRAPAQIPQQQSLVSTITTQQAHLAALNNILPTTLTTLSSTLTSLQSLHRDTLSQRIRTLEASKHGVLSRWTSSRAQFLTSVATAMSLKTRILVLEEQNKVENSLHTAGIVERMNSLHEQETNLDGRIEQLSDLLGQYETLDSDPRRGVDVLRTLGIRYGEIEKEIELVREDIEQLTRQPGRECRR